MIRTIKYRGLIKCLSRGGVDSNTSSADPYNETWFIYSVPLQHVDGNKTSFNWVTGLLL